MLKQFSHPEFSQISPEKVESLKDDEEKFKEYGIEFGIAMCKELLSEGVVGLHFYTLNQSEATLKIASALLGTTPILQN
jgi:methylenetetrahydrofolate reductase (NADPH)